ncbi:MAG: hypothetical protein ACI4LX_09430 [Treponema sp.]
MLLFSLALLPVSILIFYFQNEKNNREHFLPVIFAGLFTGIIFLAYKMLFSSAYYLPDAAFGINFLYYFVNQALLPVLVIYGLFFLFTRKDSLSARASYFFPLLASFYSVYILYMIIETDKPYSAFHVFIKPMLYLAMLVFIHVLLNKLAAVKLTSLQKLLNVLVFAVALCFPAIIESLWICGVNFFVWFVPALLFLIMTAIIIWPKSSITE